MMIMMINTTRRLAMIIDKILDERERKYSELKVIYSDLGSGNWKGDFAVFR